MWWNDLASPWGVALVGMGGFFALRLARLVLRDAERVEWGWLRGLTWMRRR